ncbi:poly-beta-1,6-N-acetyl-D-glucosamine biosynthesis protein PgaD [Halothiobacillus sp.]|uniref:poly-beta-1,6-N-acetyl-D-glucosamine biosynthesis protein PgaD n=1 Tax=Halothiobacillus sp. TaxID=1891311 RepID=UPI002612A4D6|nr:poly-beta-1,6-N-acetyl-D-glucosamine biosynthesis protein PgaD [Halothiobacillus sp.]MDD3577188.1 poly-beta-1,6-N-acetyl-D-glucosamine biosynthesis protein PgaD [Halothiobacillus sp.]MDD4966614.1 poly-beta-1,6-N-acetyl-D-glucosamine biosynthesis protein PgaD [Halothiobacillus sp.]
MSTIERPRIPEIIRRPDLVGTPKKGLLALVALMGWILWLYLLMPLGALLAWWFGYHRLDLFILSDPARTVNTLQFYTLIIGIGGLLFILWASYNWLRFRRMDRRGAPPEANAEVIAQAFSIEPSKVQLAQSGKVLAFDFDELGQIIQIEADRAALAHFPQGSQANSTQTASAN